MDNDEFAAFVGRMIRAMGARAAWGDEHDLALLIDLGDTVELATRDAVHALHYDQQFPWSTIAEATGVTKQAAQQRWGRR